MKKGDKTNEPFLCPLHIEGQIDTREFINLKKGDVILVRNEHAIEGGGDHYSVIVGGLVRNGRDVRPNLITLPALPEGGIGSLLLDMMTPFDGITIMKLNTKGIQEVVKFYDIHLSDGAIMCDREAEEVMTIVNQ